eukprot:m.32444 g.32444  ORF g.32444 m.32444 type:complete len:349 (+) comp6385_c0_seq1:387-1433(+)
MSRLHSAAWIGDAAALESLIDKGLDPNVQHPSHKSTPLHYAARRGHCEIAKILIAHGADVVAVTKDNMSPYDLAKKYKQHDVSDLLEKIGKCRLHLAAREGDPEQMRNLLLKSDAIDSRKYIGVTPLHIASTCGNIEIMRILLVHGAKTKYKDPRKRTCLHFATIHNQPEAIKLLLSSGMKTSSQDQFGRTAYDYAQMLWPDLCQIFENPPEVEELMDAPSSALFSAPQSSAMTQEGTMFQFPPSPTQMAVLQHQMAQLATVPRDFDKRSTSSSSTFSLSAEKSVEPDGDELRDLLDEHDLLDKAYHILVANEVTDFDTLKLMSKEDMLKIGLKMGVALKIIGAMRDE